MESNEIKKQKDKVDMEVTWNLDLENKANENIKELSKEKESKTPFQQYLDKRKDKKKKKKLEKQSLISTEVCFEKIYFINLY